MASDRGQLVLKTALQAGRIMIQNGSEVARVDDTLTRIAQNAGYPDSKVYVTITGIMMALSSEGNAQVEPIKNRTIDLEMVTRVNDLSRKFAAQDITLSEFNDDLDDLEAHPNAFPVWLQLVAAGFVSATLEIVFRGNYHDALVTFLIGMLGYAVFFGVNRLARVRFLSEFLAAIVIGVLAIETVKWGWGNSTDDIIVGSVMPLVPGVPLTNAVRDILSGDLVSGIARGMEAVMSAVAIGSGIAVILQLM